MEKSELIKYIVFSLHDKDNKSSNLECPAQKLAKERWGQYTFMIGHQPDNFIENDPYYTDDVGGPLNIDYNNLKLVKSGGRDIFETSVKICDKDFIILIENDCGFAVGYGPKEIYELIKE